MKIKIDDSDRRTMIGSTNIADYPKGVIVYRLSYIVNQTKHSESFDSFELANKRYEALQEKSTRINLYITLMKDSNSNTIVDEELIMSYYGDNNN